MYAVSPALKFTVENKLEGDGPPLHVDLHFGNIDDFQPEAMARQVPALKQLLDVRSAFADMTEWLAGSERLQEAVQQLCADPARMDRLATELAGRDPYETPPMLQELVESVGIRDHGEMPHRAAMLAAFFEAVVNGSLSSSQNPQVSTRVRIAELDALLSEQLRTILHHPALQQLEATWRGLHYLVRQTETGRTLKIRVLNATKRELLRDAQEATDFDRHVLFQKVHEEEFGLFGGEPYSILVGDYYF
jgi:type VI secretion system protein ImpC